MNLDPLVIGPRDECWPWQGVMHANGYGSVYDTRYKRMKLVHRSVYELAIGEIPKGIEIHHVCDNKACCNPLHLRALTAREHTLTKRTHVADQIRRTHCNYGHPLDYISPKGQRGCRTCRNEHARAYRKTAALSNPCECGCGALVRLRFAVGHNLRLEAA